MKLLLKITGWTLVCFIGLNAIVVIVLMVISDEQYKEWLTAAVASATGREFRIDGEFNIHIGSKTGITANGIHFANVEWGTRADMVSVDRLEAYLTLAPLFKGLMDVTIKIDGPDILLETDEQGSRNWEFHDRLPTPDQESGTEGKTEKEQFIIPLKPYISNMEINELIFALNDVSGGQEIKAEVEKLRVYVDGAQIPISVVAAYQGAPLELEGTLGRIDDYYSNQVTPIALQGMLNGTILNISGSLGPLFPQANARIDLSLQADSVSAFSPFAGIPLPDLKGLHVATTISAENGQYQSEKIKILLEDSKLNLEVLGSIADLAQLAGIDLNAKINSEQISSLLDEFEFSQSYSLPSSLQLQAGVRGDLKTLSVNDLNLSIHDKGLDASLVGTIENVLAPAGVNAELKIKLASTEIIGGYIGKQLPDLGPLNVSTKIVSSKQEIKLKSLLAELSDPALSATISGTVDRIGRSADDTVGVSGIKLKARVNSEKLTSIADKLNFEIPVELPASIAIDAIIAGSLDKLGVSDLRAIIRDEGVEVELTGTVENVIGPTGVDAHIQAAAKNTANLSKFVGTELPRLGSLKLDSRVISAGQSYSLETMNLQLTGDAVNAKLSAVIKDLLALIKVTEDRQSFGVAGIDASLSAEAQSTSKLLEISGIELPEMGALQLDSKIISTDRSLRLESLNLILKNEGIDTKVVATVTDLFELLGVNATIEADIDSLSRLSQFTKSGLPESGPWKLNVRAQADNGLDGPAMLAANLAGEGLDAEVNATIPDVLSPETLQAKLSVNAKSLSSLGILVNKELPNGGPLTVSGNIDAKPGEYRFDEFLVTMDDSEIRADLSYTMSVGMDPGRPKLAGQMSLKNIDLTPFFDSGDDARSTGEELKEAEKATEKILEKTGEKKPTSNKKMFSSGPLSVGVLQDYDIDLKMDATNIAIRENFSINGSAGVTLDEGLLKLGPLDIKGNTGGFGKGEVLLDARNAEASLDIFLDFDDFVLPRFGGTLKLITELNSSGGSIAALMANLSGQFLAALKDVKLKKTKMTKMGAGLVHQINPLARNTTMLECAIVRFDAKDGIADFKKKIAAQTTEVTWFGSGEINLKTEKLDLGLHPKPRRALGSLTNFSLASLIHIGGTLAKPRISVDPKGVAKKYASYSAHVATGGLFFLVEKLFDTLTANRDQCKRIIAELEKE